MNEEERQLRAQLAALEAQNASLKKRKVMQDKIDALQAENAAIGDQLAGGGGGGVAPAGKPAAEDATAVTAGGDAGQTAVTQAVPAGAVAEPATEVVVVRKSGRLRNTLVAVLVVITCLSFVVTGVAWWVHYSVFNTTGYMNLVGPIGKDPQAIKALSDYVAGQIITATDLQTKTATALPANAQFLAGPITGAVNNFVASGTQKVLSTPQAYDLWIKVNTVAHEQIVALLRGQTTYTYIQGNDVKLDTLPLISQVLVWIDGKLPGALGTRFAPPVIPPGTPSAQAIQQVSTWTGRTLPADFGQITLLQNNALGPAKAAVHLFDTLVVVLLVVTIVFVLVTIWLSRRRRHTLIELGIGVAVALILTRVIIKQGSNLLVGQIQGGNGMSLVKDVVTASLGPLTTLTIWIVVIGLIVAVVAWLSGRKDVQVAVVKAGQNAVKATTDATAAVNSPTVGWVTDHLMWLRLAGLAIGLILIVFAASGWFAIILLLFIVLLYEGVLSLVARNWPFRHEMRGDVAA